MPLEHNLCHRPYQTLLFVCSQNTISGTVEYMTSQFGLDGVYIDQIAAAGYRACFDPAHNHTIGGGHYWVDGYKELLQEVGLTGVGEPASFGQCMVSRKCAMCGGPLPQPCLPVSYPVAPSLHQTRTLAGPNAVLLTESNAEPFMSGINIYLTLVGFMGDFAGANRIVNPFGAVYGGYYLSMGAIFFEEDLT